MSIHLPFISMSMGAGVELGSALVPEVACAWISSAKVWGGADMCDMSICICAGTGGASMANAKSTMRVTRDTDFSSAVVTLGGVLP